jgi:hypothetical protein
VRVGRARHGGARFTVRLPLADNVERTDAAAQAEPLKSGLMR